VLAGLGSQVVDPRRPVLEAAPLSVAAEVTRQLLGRCAPAQLVDVLVFENCLAMDGVLQPFELGLQMLQSRLERLHPALPGDVWRSRARSPPTAIATPPPRPTQPLSDRGWLRLRWPWAWRYVASVPSLHRTTSDPLMSVAREEEGTRPKRANRRPAPRVSIIASGSAPRRALALRLPSGSGLKSCPRGQLDYPPYSVSGPGTNVILPAAVKAPA
jgi:hypothetical protein